MPVRSMPHDAHEGSDQPDELAVAALNTGSGTDLVCVSGGLTRQRADEEALVLLAMRLPCWLLLEPDGYRLCVLAAEAEAARSELDAYTADELLPPYQPVPWPMLHHRGAWIPFCLGLLVSIVFLVQNSLEPDVFDRLTMNAYAVLHSHEWWRPLTALFLHANPLHLAGNLAAGALYGFFVARSFGYLRAWILILASGYLGNCLKAILVYPEPHASIGASTAVFGALGILAGTALVEHLRSKARKPRGWWIVPLGAALALFGITGIGDGQTDTLAHFTGLTCGTALGFAAGWLWLDRFSFQTLLPPPPD
jgi:membrane associated rhomboid family serine protease